MIAQPDRMLAASSPYLEIHEHLGVEKTRVGVLGIASCRSSIPQLSSRDERCSCQISQVRGGGLPISHLVSSPRVTDTGRIQPYQRFSMA